MPLKKVMPAADAVALIQDGDVLATSGYGGNGTPEALFIALEERFLETGSPRDLTLVYAGGQGDGKDKGLNHLGHEGLLKRVIGGHYGLIPSIERLAVENKIEAYNLPEGVITHLYRDIAAGKPGTLSRVGLGTFVDPRLETLVMALAARNSGGVVLCQVERVAEAGSLDARRVRVPGILVDGVVVAPPELHMQNYGTQYNPALSGEVRVPLETVPPLPLDPRKVIARRAALELVPGSVVNLGVGLPSSFGVVANEERVADLLTLTVDPGVIGGVPLGGADFGAAVNFAAHIEHPAEFDFIDGGGLDMAVLGYAECDARGNVNASRFGNRIAGCGGFINISQNSKKVVFVGTFSSGGFEAEIADGRLSIRQEGKFAKFVEAVGQVTFSGAVAAAADRDVLYVTERCVFRLGPDGLELTEVAPGVDVDAEILARLPFAPVVREPLPMDPAIFADAPMGLRDRLLDIHIEDRLSYDPASNTIFMNYAGMRVRDQADIDRIVAAVDAVLEPLGKRVNSIVNYDSFEAAPEILDAYLDAVRYVENRYYLKVSRYTTSGFMRLRLAAELVKREVSSDMFETRQEARRHLGQD